MSWRWIVVAIGTFVGLDLVLGVCVYTTPTMNLDHTQVLIGWPAVREMCLVFFPIAFGVAVALAALLLIGIRWASGGRRR